MDQGWTEAQLLAMSPHERQRLFVEGLEIDLRDVTPDLARQALARIRVGLAEL